MGLALELRVVLEFWVATLVRVRVVLELSCVRVMVGSSPRPRESIARARGRIGVMFGSRVS